MNCKPTLEPGDLVTTKAVSFLHVWTCDCWAFRSGFGHYVYKPNMNMIKLQCPALAIIIAISKVDRPQSDETTEQVCVLLTDDRQIVVVYAFDWLKVSA